MTKKQQMQILDTLSGLGMVLVNQTIQIEAIKTQLAALLRIQTVLLANSRGTSETESGDEVRQLVNQAKKLSAANLSSLMERFKEPPGEI